MNRSVLVHDPSASTRRLLQITGLGPELGVVDDAGVGAGAVEQPEQLDPHRPALRDLLPAPGHR